MSEIYFPIVLFLLASVFQGTFGLGMKFVKPMAWEAWWLIHATVAMIIFPLVWANIVIPDLGAVLVEAPSKESGLVVFLDFLGHWWNNVWDISRLHWYVPNIWHRNGTVFNSRCA